MFSQEFAKLPEQTVGSELLVNVRLDATGPQRETNDGDRERRSTWTPRDVGFPIARSSRGGTICTSDCRSPITDCTLTRLGSVSRYDREVRGRPRGKSIPARAEDLDRVRPRGDFRTPDRDFFRGEISLAISASRGQGVARDLNAR
ncbi:hypothetical protein HN011_008125 [Eciton burchellii]|jgi:hypothetical protein|nr:hypothetical protein HN011_008125 [Eciton burchellii]